MKIKSFLLAVTLLFSVTLFAQNSELKKGKSHYNKFEQVKQVGNAALGIKSLAAAKAALEKASLHDRTKNLSETWAYLALVYTDYALIQPKSATKFKQDALAAIEKAKAGEGSKEQTQRIDMIIKTLAQSELNNGVKAFDKKDFAGAYKFFNAALTYLPGDTLFNYYAGLSAINAKNYPNAIAKYKELLPHQKFSNLPQVYLDLSRMYMMEKDTASAVKYASEGAAKFPTNASLATQNIELNLQIGNEEKVVADIAKQIQKTPNDARLHFYYGIALNASNKNDEAEAAYKKAIEVDPAFGNAYVNLGGLLLNKGITVFREASKLPPNKQKEYNEQAKIGNALVDEAFPVVLKATEVSPTLPVAWQNLKTYYQLKDDKKKVAEIEEKMKSL